MCALLPWLVRLTHVSPAARLAIGPPDHYGTRQQESHRALLRAKWRSGVGRTAAEAAEGNVFLLSQDLAGHPAEKRHRPGAWARRSWSHFRKRSRGLSPISAIIAVARTICSLDSECTRTPNDLGKTLPIGSSVNRLERISASMTPTLSPTAVQTIVPATTNQDL